MYSVTYMSQIDVNKITVITHFAECTECLVNEHQRNDLKKKKQWLLYPYSNESLTFNLCNIFNKHTYGIYPTILCSIYSCEF